MRVTSFLTVTDNTCRKRIQVNKWNQSLLFHECSLRSVSTTQCSVQYTSDPQTPGRGQVTGPWYWASQKEWLTSVKLPAHDSRLLLLYLENMTVFMPVRKNSVSLNRAKVQKRWGTAAVHFQDAQKVLNFIPPQPLPHALCREEQGNCIENPAIHFIFSFRK